MSDKHYYVNLYFSSKQMRCQAPCQVSCLAPFLEIPLIRKIHSYKTLTMTIILLIFSNIFMTFAWYGHLKYKSSPLFKVIIISWLIAFFEYCLQVPANRIGSYSFSTAQLKVIQEVITLIVFCAFSVLYLKEDFKWNTLIGFLFMVGAVFFVFKD
ncbi:MAG: conserved rane protein of unknown function [Bacteriovoracaceae bacterium]|nr:conserved rane protein of unknown function [Bacteriovoracaceae bacterium]